MAALGDWFKSRPRTLEKAEAQARPPEKELDAYKMTEPNPNAPPVELERGSTKWCQRLAEIISLHYLDTGKPWRKLAELGDPKAGMGGNRRTIAQNAWDLFALDADNRYFENPDMPQTADISKETSIAIQDVELLFEKSREYANKRYGKK